MPCPVLSPMTKYPSYNISSACSAAGPDCFGNAAPQLGRHPAPDASGYAFANRYTSPPNNPARTAPTAAVSASASVTSGGMRRCATARRHGLGNRRKRSSMLRRRNLSRTRGGARGTRGTRGTRRTCSTCSTRRTCSTCSTRGARRSRRSRRARGGGYYLDLSPCPPGGMPSTVGYSDNRPPLFVHPKK